MNKKVFMILFLTVMLGMVSMTWATTRNVPADYATIQAAIDAASNSDEILIAGGEYDVEATIVINRELTISGPTSGTAIVRGTGLTNIISVFEITSSNVTIQRLDITHVALPSMPNPWIEINNSMVRIPGPSLTNIQLLNNNIYVPLQSGAMSTWNGVALTVANTGSSVTLTGNNVYNTRNGIVVHYNNTVNISNNNIYNTKGGIMNYTGSQADADNRTMVNNTWGTTHNEWDMVWNSGGAVYTPDYNQSVLVLSGANNEAYVLSLLPTSSPTPLTGNRSHVFVNSTTGTTTQHNANGNMNKPYATFALGLNAVVAGGKVYVSAGSYYENAYINKRLTLIGAGSGDDPITNTVLYKKAVGADSKEGIIQITGSGLSVANPILIQDIRILPVGVAGISVGRFTEATGINVSYLKFQNVQVWGTNTNPSTEQERGFYVDLTSTASYLDFVDCTFNNLTYGWYIQKQVSADASTVSYISVTNTTFNHNNHKGVYAEKLAHATFTGCTAHGNGYDASMLPSYFQAWSCGIDVNLKAGAYTDLTFDDCIITNNGNGGAWEGVGLALKARNDASSYNTYPATLNGIVVTDCTITGNERGVRIGEPGKGNSTPLGVVLTGNTITNNRRTYVGTQTPSAYGDVVNATSSEGVVVDGRTVSIGKALWNIVPGLTIQDAINATLPGDLVLVAAGIYNEAITVSKGVSLLGAGADYTFIDATGKLANAVKITATSGNVKIDGFKIFNALTANGDHFQITVSGGGSGCNIEITNNMIIGATDAVNNDYGLYSNAASNLIISNNTFSNCGTHSILLERHRGTSEIAHNTLTNVVGSNNCSAIVYMTYKNPTDQPAAYEITTKQSVHGNIINANQQAGITFFGPWGQWNQYLGGKYTDIEITDNVITNIGDYCSGLQLESDADNGGIYNAVISGNTMTPLLGSTYARGIRMLGNVINSSITHNTITGFWRGIRQTFTWGQGATPGPSGNSIHFNTITGTTDLAIENQYTGVEHSIDASRNYWGSPIGLIHSTNPLNNVGTAQVSDNVTFMPWYATPTTTPDTEFATLKRNVGSKAVITVFTSDELANALASAVNNDEIVLGSGTFVGNFVIAADITIIAATGTVPVIQGVNGGAALTITADGVSITGVTIQADEDDDAVVVTAAVADGATVSVVNGSIIVSGAGIGVVNNSVNNGSAYVLATGNWWGGVDPAILISGTVDYGDALDIEPLIIRVTADEVLIKDVEELLYTVSVSQVTNLNSYKVQLKFRKADFNAPVFEDDFVIGALFVNDFFDYELIADTNYYIYEVTGSNLGLGITGENVVLFTVNLTSKLNASNLSGSLVTIVYGTVVLYGTGNPPDIITCTGTSGKLVVIDSDEPLLAAIPQTSGETLLIDAAKSAEAGYAKVVDTLLTLSFSDDYNLDFLRYKVQLQTADVPEVADDFATDIATGISGTLWNNEEENWQIPDALLNAGLDDLPTGSYSIFFYAQDDAGNYNIFSWDFLIDKTATEPITWVKCLTTPDSNNKIDLEWTNNGTVANNHIWVLNYDHLSLEAGAYPEFNPAGFVVPDVPAINQYGGSVENGWQKTIIAANTTYLYEPAGRGYYYFAIFSEDAAGNISTAPVYKESISYWPGDIDADGDVEATGDITALSTVWGLTSASVGWDANLDVGPSVDRTRRGLRTPDDRINIEDLMMFSMNYGNTDYDPYPRGDDELTPIRIELLTEIAENNLVVQVMLSENTGIVKGLNIPVQYGTGLSLQSVELGGIWPEDSVVLYTNNQNVAEVSMTTLGANSLVLENGNVATLTFVIEGTVLDTELKHMIARNIDNAEIEIINNPDTEPTGNEDLVIVIPAANFLGNNYPNPFNPSTTFQFGLKQAQNVKITIYNVRGQVVKTLVNGMTPAGIHNIVWNGKDNNNRAIASGMYFYKMETNDYSKVKKTILLK
jgi:hypothetical protein